MTTADPFWVAIATQIEELRSAADADDVLRILSPERDPYGLDHETGGDGFFAGSGGEETVYEALQEAGWKVVWYQASYYYAICAPDGSIITYIEGDIYSGNCGLTNRPHQYYPKES